MNWIDRLLMRFFDFLWRKKKGKKNPHYFVITNEVGDPYMCRYRLFKLPFFKVYLHHILRSDEDQFLHDHPWNFVSFILWSGYLEQLPGRSRMVRPGAMIRHRATDSHRLILERPAWTLVLVTGKKRTWGFHTKSGWMAYWKFFDRKYGQGQWETY
jgi:hypothetical protein